MTSPVTILQSFQPRCIAVPEPLQINNHTGKKEEGEERFGSSVCLPYTHGKQWSEKVSKPSWVLFNVSFTLNCRELFFYFKNLFILYLWITKFYTPRSIPKCSEQKHTVDRGFLTGISFGGYNQIKYLIQKIKNI